MIEFIQNFFSTIFGNNVVLATILISMVPIIEVKGAIPFAMSSAIWGEVALDSTHALLYSLIGSSILVPLLALLYIPLIRWLKSTKLFRRLAEKIENKINRHKLRVDDRVQSQYRKNGKGATIAKIIGVLSFVILPLPFTGVWTGTCLAVALGLSFPVICVTVIMGNAIAGLVITLFSHYLGDKVMLIALLSVIGILFLVFATKKIIDVIVTKHAKKEDNKPLLSDNDFTPEDQE